MNRAALTELRKKVEAGAFHGHAYKFTTEFGPAFKEHSPFACNAYFGSLDAAKALHEAVLPGWEVACIRKGDASDVKHDDCQPGDWLANLRTKDFKSVTWTAGDQTTTDTVSGKMRHAWSLSPARAWLLAILSALIAEGDG